MRREPGTPVHLLGTRFGLSIGSYISGFLRLIFLSVVISIFIFIILKMIDLNFINNTINSTPSWLKELGKLLLTSLWLLAIHWTLRLQGRDLMSVIAPGKRLHWAIWARSALIYAVCFTPSIVRAALNGDAEIAMPSAVTLLFLPALLVGFALQTATEEVFCRGYLAQGFQVLFRNAVVAALPVAIIFSLMHGWNGGERQVIYWSLSLFASYLTWRFGRLEAAMGMHFAHNFLITLFMTGGEGLSALPEMMKPDNVATFPFAEMLSTALTGCSLFLLYWFLGIRTGFIEHGWRGKPAPQMESV